MTVSVPEPVQLPLGSINFAPYNPRKISVEEMRALKASIETNGFVVNLVVQKQSDDGTPNVLIAGHQRVRGLVELCHDKGWPEPEHAWCVLMDVDDRKAKLLNVGLNKIGGEFVPELLGAVFEDILPDLDDFDVLATGFTRDDLETLVALRREEPEAEDGPTEPIPARAAVGQVWRLGKHRLLVGDSTDAHLVDSLLDEPPVMQIVDPPFDVAYDAWPLQPTAGIVMVWQRGISSLTWQAATFTPDRWAGHELVFVGRAHGLSIPTFPCTVHEVAYMWRRSDAVSHTFDRNVLTLAGCKTTEHGDRPFSVQQSSGGSWHPHAKGIMAMEVAMAYVRPGDVIWDPCAGGGTSLIAAEKQRRVWRGAEKDPTFASGILTRWEKHTNKTALLEG